VFGALRSKQGYEASSKRGARALSDKDRLLERAQERIADLNARLSKAVRSRDGMLRDMSSRENLARDAERRGYEGRVARAEARAKRVAGELRRARAALADHGIVPPPAIAGDEEEEDGEEDGDDGDDALPPPPPPPSPPGDGYGEGDGDAHAADGGGRAGGGTPRGKGATKKKKKRLREVPLPPANIDSDEEEEWRNDHHVSLHDVIDAMDEPDEEGFHDVDVSGAGDLPAGWAAVRSRTQPGTVCYEASVNPSLSRRRNIPHSAASVRKSGISCSRSLII